MKCLLTIACCLIVSMANAQKIEVSQIERMDTVTGNRRCDMTCYKIFNDTDEDLLTWFSKRPVNNMSDNEKIRDYLVGRCEDECLVDLFITDKLATNSLRNLGKDFIKNIHPRKTFCYLIKTDKQKGWSNLIVTVKRKDTELFMLTHILDEYFYPQDSIVVIPENIFK